MALTDVKCRGAKPGKTRVKLSDGGGLQFWVQPNGSRLWQLVYQYQGKQAQMALGPYPQVTLIEERALREEAKSKIRAGIDPRVARTQRDKIEGALLRSLLFQLQVWNYPHTEALLCCRRRGYDCIAIR